MKFMAGYEIGAFVICTLINGVTRPLYSRERDVPSGLKKLNYFYFGFDYAAIHKLFQPPTAPFVP